MNSGVQKNSVLHITIQNKMAGETSGKNEGKYKKGTNASCCVCIHNEF